MPKVMIRPSTKPMIIAMSTSFFIHGWADVKLGFGWGNICWGEVYQDSPDGVKEFERVIPLVGGDCVFRVWRLL